MLVEFIFHRNQLDLTAGQIEEKILPRLNELHFSNTFSLKSTTVMSKWLVVLIDIPSLEKVFPPLLAALDIIAGTIVVALKDYAVRYRHHELHGVTSSLLFKKEWRTRTIALNCIARDEGPYIENFLGHIKDFVDDMVVIIDSRTIDNTAEVAMKNGARVFFKEWQDDFSMLRNKALAETVSEWVLSLDVDERISEELLLNLRDLINTDRFDAYELIKVNEVAKDRIPQVRLFRRIGSKWEGRVHEIVSGIIKDRTWRTNFSITHHQRWIANGGKRAEDRNAFYRRLEKINQ